MARLSVDSIPTLSLSVHGSRGEGAGGGAQGAGRDGGKEGDLPSVQTRCLGRCTSGALLVQLQCSSEHAVRRWAAHGENHHAVTFVIATIVAARWASTQPTVAGSH